MIFGIGVDLAETARFLTLHEQYGVRFSRRILTDYERNQLQGKTYPERYLATRFAAKEAAVKALGTGFSDGIGYQSIEVRNDVKGKPELYFYHAALERMKAEKVSNARLSLADEKTHVVAMVVIEYL